MFANAQRKTQQCLLSLSVSLKKLANNNSSPTLTFSFKKKPQKVGLRTNGKLFFSFCFLICQKKRVVRDKLFCFFFVEQKHCEVWTKNNSPSDSKKLKFPLLFCFRQQKNFYFFAFSQLGNKKRRSGFLATSMNLPREKASMGFS